MFGKNAHYNVDNIAVFIKFRSVDSLDYFLAYRIAFVNWMQYGWSVFGSDKSWSYTQQCVF